ncbi:SBBP repeat-containing protein [Candidatus Zixiibacteriota bacterium]
MPFILNAGQLNRQVLFYTPTANGTTYLTTAGDIVYSLQIGTSLTGRTELHLTESIVNATVENIKGLACRSTTVNWFKGVDPSAWRVNIPTYGAVSLGEVYPGVEAMVLASRQTVEKVFFVEPGADPGAICLQVSGADSLTKSPGGELAVHTPAGPVAFTKPMAYQETSSGREDVEISYSLTGDTYGFQLGEYDPSRALTIDPMLAFTFYGGAGNDLGWPSQPGVLDHEGNVVIAGWTTSPDLPTTPGVFEDTKKAGEDAYVAKFSPDLNELLSATFLGGNGNDRAFSVVVDGAGDIFVAGNTWSTDFPTTPGAYDRNDHPSLDCFVAKLSGDLSQLLAGTYLGGADSVDQRGLALDNDDNLYVGTWAKAADMPFFTGAFDNSYNGGNGDLYLAKFTNDLSTLLAGTYLGGDSFDVIISLGIGPTGDIYCSGASTSMDFPVTPAAYDTFLDTVGSGTQIYLRTEGIVCCLSPDLDSLVASTYLGGDSSDFTYGLAIDANGDVYVTGHVSGSYPTTPGAYDPVRNGEGLDEDACVTRLSADLSTLLASTFIGGSDWDWGTAVALDGQGHVIVVGGTPSVDFPTTPGADDPVHNGNNDIFVARLDTALQNLEMCTFIGGTNSDMYPAVLPLGQDNYYVLGNTASANFPTVPGGFMPSFPGTDGTWSAFISKISFSLDYDDDGIENTLDNCWMIANPKQDDNDLDGVGDSCDNCRELYNPDQADINNNGIGDSCEVPELWYVQANGLGEAPTIQAAIDSSTHGDTVVVAEGVYRGDGNRDINSHRRNILLRSENGPAFTIIDCEGSLAEPHRAFTFEDEEDSVFIVDGFTMRGGYGPLHSSAACGGGMFFDRASPTVKNCIFTDNYAVLGGALYLNHAAPRLFNCTFAGNSANYGAAVFAYDNSLVLLEDCVMAFNSGGLPVICLENSAANLACSDVYGNAGGDWIGCLAGQEGINGNFSADPLFCNVAIGDVGLADESSPCRPANNECGVLVGAMDLECACDCGLWGDINDDGSIDPVDVVIVVNYVYRNIDQRIQPLICATVAADVDCSGVVDPLDVAHFVNYVYRGYSPLPCVDPCAG